MNTVRRFTDNINFGISKCATLGMKRGKKVEEDRKQMPGEIYKGDLGDGAYKNPGALKSDKNKKKEIKLKVKQDYYRRASKVTESSLNGGNTVKTINT